MEQSKTKRRDQQRYLKLLPYEQVRSKIIEALRDVRPPLEEIRVDKALGRVCAEIVRSKQNIPPRTIAAMDGYAIRSGPSKKATLSDPVYFSIKGSLYPESQEPLPKVQGLDAYYTATGSPIPTRADAVVKVEDTRLDGDRIALTRVVQKGKNISFRGEDVHTGQIILRKADMLNAAEIALLISVGRTHVVVFKTPRVGILSVGNELTTFDEPDDRKVVNNYSNLVAGYVSEMGESPTLIGISKDNPVEIQRTIKRWIDKLDLLITIGGSSVGVRDYTPDAVSEGRGSKLLFHGVRVVPIRPAGFAMMNDKIPVIILPGHAVSAALSFFALVLPVLNLLCGLPFDARQPTLKARSRKRFSNDRAIDAMYLVRLEAKNGEFSFDPLSWGSNLMQNLARSNGFVRLKPHQTISKDEVASINLLGGSEILRISRGEPL